MSAKGRRKRDCLWYLDDCIFFTETDEEMMAILHGGEYAGRTYAGVINDCKRLGLPVNFEKSVLVPVRVIEWLGYVIDLVELSRLEVVTRVELLG